MNHSFMQDLFIITAFNFYIMKHILLFLSFIAVSQLYAQVNVTLHMDQLLNGEPFAYNQAKIAAQGYAYKMTRVEYYISEINLVHDGGQITAATDVYLLVDPGTQSEFTLGIFNLIDLEQIQFSVGVDPGHNHLDPSTYPSGHPLAPQNPTMHWGWTPGYRFIALEGFAGPDTNSVNNNYQIHTIGDANYRSVTIDVNGEINGSEMAIHLDAEYEHFFDGLNLTNGMVSHASTGASKTIADNARFVFSASEITGIVEPGVIGSFQITPNPAKDHAICRFDFPGSTKLQMVITDFTGRNISTTELDNFASAFEIDCTWPPGIYLARMYNGNKLVGSEKLIIR